MTDAADTLPLAPTPYARADQETWARARADYEAGWSAPVVAERHGLGERNVRRRATAEGWKRGADARGPAAGGAPLAEMQARLALALAASPPDAEAELAQDEHLQDVAAAHELEVGRLLLGPTPRMLTAFAFRRAAEAGARSAPAETLAWLKVVKALEQSRNALRGVDRPHSAADYERAVLARMLQQIQDGETPDTMRASEEVEAAADAQDSRL